MEDRIPKEAWRILASFQARSKGDLFLVGGFLRDLLLGRDSKDMDLLYFGNPLDLLEGMPCPWFPLDPLRGIYRAICGGYQVDISAPKAPTLEEDLQERDFTVNAMAYSLSQKQLADPWGGRRDMRLRRLRALTPWTFKKDPLRLLRTYRLSLLLGFSPTPDTLEMLRRDAHLLPQAAPERIREELSLILSHPLSSKAFYAMDACGALSHLLPEVEEGRGILQGKWCGTDLKGHLLGTLKALERILPFLSYLFPNHTFRMKGILKKKVEGGISMGVVLKLASLLHDIGKPPTMAERGEDLTFWGHDREGGVIAKGIGRRLGLGTNASTLLSLLIAHHMWIHLLARQDVITPKAKGRFFRRLGDKGVLVALLSLADTLASSGERGFFYFLPKVEELLSFYYTTFLSDERMQRPLLNGKEVMKILSLSPGPKVGEILKALVEAQEEGKVRNREEAVAFITRL